MVPVFAEIEWNLIVQVIWVSLVAGVAVTAIFSLVILSGARASEARRSGNTGVATAFGVVTAIALVAFLAGCFFGVSIILTK